MKNAGFTIIELVVFIVVVGIIATVVLIPLGTMLRDSQLNDQGNIALMLANAHMEYRQGQRRELGYEAFGDGTSVNDGTSSCTQAICTFLPIPDGYSILTYIENGYSNSTNYSQVTVKVTGEKPGLGNATVKALFADY